MENRGNESHGFHFHAENSVDHAPLSVDHAPLSVDHGAISLPWKMVKNHGNRTVGFSMVWIKHGNSHGRFSVGISMLLVVSDIGLSNI